MPNLEKRRQLYYAVLTIPLKAREQIGKLRYVQSTGTGDKRQAQLIANQYVAGWRVLIQKALGEAEDTHLVRALQWREELQKSLEDEQREIVEGLLLGEAHSMVDKVGLTKAKEFYDISSGSKTLCATSYELWKAQLTLEQKTIDQMSRDVKLLVDQFSALEDITHSSVFEWVESLEAKGKTASSRIRLLKGCKNYWGYLKAKKLVSIESNPFANLVAKPKGKASRKLKANAPYTPEEVVMLWNEAQSQTRYGKPYCDQQLADLILLSAYTGTRIEELCSLKLADVTSDSFKFIDSKTEAGIREVPIHSKLLPTIKRLKEQSKDGYLITKLPSNKYNKRSGVMSKRFGILKTKLGFSSRIYTAHSFRSTLVTMLENAGITENLAADIVGHKKPRVTYGLYSGGATVELMREALEKVSYPFAN